MHFPPPSTSSGGTKVSEVACDPKTGMKLLVETPVNSSNFKEYNRTTDTIDISRLSQPINEAGYDSETQACIDLLEASSKGGPSPSFYDHFVTQPIKKKNMKGVGLEEPALPWERAPPPPDSLSDSSNNVNQYVCGGVPSPRSDFVASPSMDFLGVPPQLEVPEHRCMDGGHHLLDNPEVRRLATGTMPPHRLEV